MRAKQPFFEYVHFWGQQNERLNKAGDKDECVGVCFLWPRHEEGGGLRQKKKCSGTAARGFGASKLHFTLAASKITHSSTTACYREFYVANHECTLYAIHSTAVILAMHCEMQWVNYIVNTSPPVSNVAAQSSVHCGCSTVGGHWKKKITIFPVWYPAVITHPWLDGTFSDSRWDIDQSIECTMQWILMITQNGVPAKWYIHYIVILGQFRTQPLSLGRTKLAAVAEICGSGWWPMIFAWEAKANVAASVRTSANSARQQGRRLARCLVSPSLSYFKEHSLKIDSTSGITDETCSLL